MSNDELAKRIPFSMPLHITEDAMKGWGSSRYTNKALGIGGEHHTRRKTKRYYYVEAKPEIYGSLAALLEAEPEVRKKALLMYAGATVEEASK